MEDDDLIPLSALQHYLYCPRQCALIHLEQLWADNPQTVEGHLLHERADQPGMEQRHGIKTITAMPLASPRLGIGGVADVVEFHPTPAGEIPRPVEYKRGRPKAHRADEVQLCAQAMCLESMLNQPVPEGDLFYGKQRRRKTILFDDSLRRLTLETIARTRQLFDGCRTPKAEYQSSRCDHCSLLDLCQPRLANHIPVSQWLRQQLEE